VGEGLGVRGRVSSNPETMSRFCSSAVGPEGTPFCGSAVGPEGTPFCGSAVLLI
jgi:hypothetical protein